MKGLFTLVRTNRSARVCVISPRSTMCCFLIVFKAYIRPVLSFLTCRTYVTRTNGQWKIVKSHWGGSEAQRLIRVQGVIEWGNLPFRSFPFQSR